MKRLIASRISNSKYDAIVEGVVDSIEEYSGEWCGYVYSRDLERAPYDFYQGVVVFEPFSDSEVKLNLQPGDKVKLGVVLAKEPCDTDIVDIIEKVG